ncbi:SDR family NAD(P)-dependent oxidoreductase [Acanthopleuribacter pedis]|uniref:SDR family oxidoreductase n=1 Tax=Acanthopleuribacter pedis TaxID=442870 RepID=A0A8J7Q2E8_9BACT|nr:SDR family NAD(P)-dependent oxidoreductase [Acanthopleuribacter pedis]MBO1317454.1 SDR family oxidoreductase [Acanthopleuribacter pedis]
MSQQRFLDQVFVITGGGTGIGKDIARTVLNEGGKVVINGRRAEVLAETARELDPSGERVRFFAGSIALVETARSLIGLAKTAFGRVDVLVNNAGVFKPTPFLEHDEAEFAHYLDIILKGTFFASQAAIGEMVKQGTGAVVNVGSMWADHAVGATPSSAYSAAKAGVHALTRNLAIEFAARGIRVNAVAPAVVETPVYDTFLSPEQKREVLPGFNQFHPLGRNGQPADVTAAVLFLASQDAGWITGAVLPVDGGVTAGRG